MTEWQLRILLVDAQGALGQSLAGALSRLGCEVTWFGRFPAPEGPAMTVLPGMRDQLDGLLASNLRFDAVVDAGASSHQDASLLHAVLRNRVGLVIHISSWHVYRGAVEPGAACADPPALPLREDAPKVDGPSLDAEDGLWQARAHGGYPATVLRLGAVYGPGVALAREWHVVDRLRRGREYMAIPDAGGQLLHRVYVDNAVHAIIAALDHPREADGAAFNVADSDVPTVYRLCQEIAASVGSTMETIALPHPWYNARNPWAVPHPIVLDIHRMRSRLGYQEPVPPSTALLHTVRWLWDLPDDEVLGTLTPYWQQFGRGHDYLSEDRALAAWRHISGSVDHRGP